MTVRRTRAAKTLEKTEAGTETGKETGTEKRVAAVARIETARGRIADGMRIGLATKTGTGRIPKSPGAADQGRSQGAANLETSQGAGTPGSGGLVMHRPRDTGTGMPLTRALQHDLAVETNFLLCRLVEGVACVTALLALEKTCLSHKINHLWKLLQTGLDLEGDGARLRGSGAEGEATQGLQCYPSVCMAF